MKKLIKQYMTSRLKYLKAMLQSFKKNGDPAALHGIRVEIKKIKAVLRFLGYQDKDFSIKKLFKPFRVIFREAGNIREPLVMYQLAKSNHLKNLPPPENRNKSIRNFRAEVSKNIRRIQRQQKTILKYCDEANGNAYKKYISKKRGELKKGLYPSFQPKDLHNIRKLMKEIDYLESVNHQKNSFTRFLKNCEIIIGDWHDQDLFIHWIKLHAPGNHIVVKKLQSENNARVRKLKSVVSEFYSGKHSQNGASAQSVKKFKR